MQEPGSLVFRGHQVGTKTARERNDLPLLRTVVGAMEPEETGLPRLGDRFGLRRLVEIDTTKMVPQESPKVTVLGADRPFEHLHTSSTADQTDTGPTRQRYRGSHRARPRPGFEPRIPRVPNSGLCVPCVSFPRSIKCEIALLKTRTSGATRTAAAANPIE